MAQQILEGENLHFTITSVVNIVIFVIMVVGQFFYIRNEVNKIKTDLSNIRDEKESDKDILTSSIKKSHDELCEKITNEVTKLNDTLELKIKRVNELINSLENILNKEINNIEKILDGQKKDDDKLKELYDNLKNEVIELKTVLTNFKTSITTDKEHFKVVMDDKLELIEKKYGIHIDNINKMLDTNIEYYKEGLNAYKERINVIEKRLESLYKDVYNSK